MKLLSSLVVGAYAAPNVLHSSFDPGQVVAIYRESQNDLMRVARSDGVSKFSLDTFQDTGFVERFVNDIVPEDKNVVTKFLFAGTYYGVEKVFYLNENDELYIKDFDYELINSQPGVPVTIFRDPNKVKLDSINKIYVHPHFSHPTIMAGKRGGQDRAVVGLCNESYQCELEYMMEPSEYHTWLQRAGAGTHYQNFRSFLDGDVMFTRQCELWQFHENCPKIPDKPVYYNVDALHGGQALVAPSIGTQLLRPWTAKFEDPPSCGVLTADGKLPIGCDRPERNIYRLVSKADDGLSPSVETFFVGGCGISIYVLEGTIWLQTGGEDAAIAESVDTEGFASIEIIRDATVLTVIFGDSEVVFSTLTTEHIGECEFIVQLPDGFGPLEINIFSDQVEEHAPEQTATVPPPSKTKTVELPSKTRTERQCRPKGRHGLRRLAEA